MLFSAARRRLTSHERAALSAFEQMSLNAVRQRAEEFEDAQSQYETWLETRRRNRDGPPEGPELDGYAPEAQYGDPAARWRELERQLRARGAWLVGDLGDRECLRWARRLNALSDSLSRPQRRSIGPGARDALRKQS